MQFDKRKTLLLLVIAQCCCVTVGLGFHYIYCAAAITHEEQETVRAQIGSPLRQAAAELGPRGLTALLQDQVAVRKAFDHCRDAAGAAGAESVAQLLDVNGRIVAASDSQAPGAKSPAEPLRLSGANAAWGRFDGPIFGLLPQDDGRVMIALAQPLLGHDGYLLLACNPAAARFTAASIRGTLGEASGISLVWTCGLLGVTLYMIMNYFQNEQVRSRVQPELEALKQAQTLVRTQESIIFGLAKLSDSRDSETGNHLERISQYASALSSAMRQKPEYRDVITTDFVNLIGISSALHDIGKVGVADAILRKPGMLTATERLEMQKHAEVGEECLREIERRLGTSNFLQMAREIAAAHHERWDGSGYPRGLAGEQIPLPARIVAIADVYDALSSRRVYKEAMSHEQCVERITDAAGTQFDPRIVEVFLQIQERFQQIARQFASYPEPLARDRRASESGAIGDSDRDADSSPALALDHALQLIDQANQ